MDSLFNFTSEFDLVNSTFDQLLLIGILLLGWAIVFLLVNQVQLPNMAVKQLNDTKNRIVSIIHGLLTFIMSTWIIFFAGEPSDVEYPIH